LRTSRTCIGVADLHHHLETFGTATVRAGGPAGFAVVPAELPKVLSCRAALSLCEREQKLRHLLGCTRESS